MVAEETVGMNRYALTLHFHHCSAGRDRFWHYHARPARAVDGGFWRRFVCISALWRPADVLLCRDPIFLLTDPWQSVRSLRAATGIVVLLVRHGHYYLIMGMAESLAVLFIGRIISGIGASTMSTCNAYVADVTPPDQRAQNFGLIGARLAWDLL